jgi:HEAT repeat protein
MRRVAVAVLLFTLCGTSRAQSVQQILDSKALAKEYNPVLVGFLLEEGKGRLTAKQQKDALDQQLARFREEIDVKPSGQVAASVATLAGMFVGGDVGAGIAEGAADVWRGWVDAAQVLQRAGYEKEVIPFFQNCIRNFPYESLQARCATSLAAAQPDEAIPFLVGVINDKAMPEEAKSAALRTIGWLAADEKFPRAQRDAAIAELIKRTEGMMNSTLFEAAVDGLVRANDPRAVEPLRKMTKGMTKGEEVKRAAVRGLALTYKDAAGIDALKAGLKGGMMSSAENQLFSAATLILADEQAGFDWAADKLAPKKKARGGGFLGKMMATDSNKVDPEPRLMAALFQNGNAKSKELMAAVVDAHAPGEWIYARANISLLRLGDTSRIDTVKQIATSEAYIPKQRADAAAALAKHKEYAGIAPLATLAAAKKTKNDEKMAIASALAKIDHDDVVPPLTALLADPDADVRIAAAFALADLARPSALDGLAKAATADYGRATSEVQAYVVRRSAKQFPKETRTKSIIESTQKSKSASVQFLSASLAAKR